MVAVAAAAGIGSVKDGVVQPIDGGIHDTNEVVFWNSFFQIHWQAKLVYGILNVQRNRSFLKWLLDTSILPKGISFCDFRKNCRNVPRLTSGEDGQIAEKR